ncbi:LacI family DNA-binding transcriptional regulator [Lentisalinibacter orientalis]|uniref:LacI family DNA-binding transcriptional regulator n=1 Tax=Lentisalinibacter orientalis TaxID=2992241 RepID=UPI003870A7A6
MGRVTIEDVASLAGVSIKTVSRVVNREPNVRSDTRQRVEKAIRELDYTPNTSARSLAGNRSFLIGLLYVNPAASYIINILTGAVDACRAGGFELLLHPCNYTDADLPGQISELARNTRLDGLILTPPLSDLGELIAELDTAGIPLARIAPGAHDDAGRSVCTNDKEICAELARYVISLGHRDIGFIVGHPDQLAVQQRYAGFRLALKEAGLKVRKSLVCHGDNSFESGVDCARRLLQRKRRPTAVIASTDDMAAGLISVAHELGIRIPDELSVTGFDDVPLAHKVWPPLTTIRQPMQAMGERAAALLLARLSEDGSGEEGANIPSEIVIRESTGPAPE